MIKLNFSWLETALKTTVTFGKKNAPALMTGGSILVGWGAVYVFWQGSKKAEKEIERQKPEGEEKLPVKEQAMIYLKYCWIAGVMGLASTGLAIGAQKLSLDRLAEMYLLTQFLENKNSDKDRMIEKMKSELTDKKIAKIENEILEEDYPEQEVLDYISRINGDDSGKTLFIDKVTHAKFRADLVDVTDGIAEINRMLRNRRRAKLKQAGRGPFDVSDGPFPEIDEDTYDPEIYSTVGLDLFLEAIGETLDDGIEARMDELLEFRYYGGGTDLLKAKDILKYKQYRDPATGIPVTCYIDYTEFLSPSFELMERNPL